MTILIYMLAGALAAILLAGLSYYANLDRKMGSLLTVLAVMIALFLTRTYGIPYYQAANFESDIKKASPLFALLAQKSPETFNRYVAAVKKDILNNQPQNILYKTSDFVNAEVMKYAVYSSNQALYNQMKGTLDFYQHLFKINPKLVLISEFPERFTNEPEMDELVKASKSYIDRLLKAKEDIIISAITHPAPALSRHEILEAQALLGELFDALAAEYGSNNVETTFQNPQSPSLDKTKGAEIIIQFYQRLVKRGERETGLVLRYIASASAR
ncbi:hypothetical protein [Legionella erythra]|uniref:Uncharacterized protein n=1 Tax=Legionella erythra TaxID=448 RepID=A0A0W0TS47_LEGER|nr:hypothetical protein [Legionella erythra]KTC98409.1 hypothetical protein Lery_0972 [Legionella erythra]